MADTLKNIKNDTIKFVCIAIGQRASVKIVLVEELIRRLSVNRPFLEDSHARQ